MIAPLATEYGATSAASTGADNATAAIKTLATNNFFTWAPVAFSIFWGAILTLRCRFDVPFPPQLRKKFIGLSRLGTGERDSFQHRRAARFRGGHDLGARTARRAGHMNRLN